MDLSQIDLSQIRLSLPLRAEFVSVVRLTGSGIASRAGFDFDAVEDIKVCLSEVCNSLLNDKDEKGCNIETEILIEFIVSNESLLINFRAEETEGWTPSIESGDENDFGLMIARVLMDEFDTTRKDGFVVSMMKRIAEID